jgi:VWFA-related protein
MRHSATLYSFVLLAAFVGVSRFDEGVQEPSFRAAIHLVEVQVIATGKRGEPIQGLTQSDFEVFEDDRRQTISTFASVDTPTLASPSPHSVDADVETNADLRSNGVWVLLLDEPAAWPGNTFTRGATYTRLTQNVARRFVDEVVTPADLVAVIHVQGSMAASQPLTRSKSLALRSIDRFIGGRGVDGATAREEIAMIVNTYRTIEEVAKRLGAMTVRRKALLWIGGQVPFAPQSGQKEYQEAAPILHAAYRDAIEEAQRNDVAIYPVDPSGLSAVTAAPRSVNLDGLPAGATAPGRTPEPDVERQAALRIVAEDTGGYAVLNTNDFARGFARIRNENSSYYLLGYYPPVQHTDGKFHEIKVRLTRPDIAIRARKGYVAPLAARDDTANTVRVSTAVNALRNPLPATGIRISIFATPFKGTNTPGTVVVGAHINGEELSSIGDDVLEVAYQVIDAEGRTVTTRAMDYALPVDADQRAKIRTNGVQFIDTLALKRGRFEIRLAAGQRGGNVGSIVTYVDVPDFHAGRLSMSGLLVRSNGTSSPIRLGKLAEPPAGVDATSIREFPSAARLIISGAVYSDADISPDTIALDASIRDANGNLVRDGVPGLLIRERRTAIGERSVEVDASLQGLRPGSYVFRLSARLTTRSRVTAERAFPLRIAP